MITPFALFPVLVADDLAALKSFYETHFGFRSEFYQQDFYLHLKHPESSIQLGFMVPDHPTQPEYLHPKASSRGMVISLEVTDARAAFCEAQSAALDIAFDYREESFGVTHFMIRDPAGLIIDIVEHQEPPTTS